MDSTPQTDTAPATLWNGLAGGAWVAVQASLDQIVQPFEAQ